jgi:plasmid stabilization system protein ParE
MNYKSIMLPDAKNDLRESTKWYGLADQNLGKQFIEQVRVRIRQLKRNPYVCQIRYKEVRGAMVKHFPYIIFYIINENKKALEIFAISHTSRNPEIWKSRIK